MTPFEKQIQSDASRPADSYDIVVVGGGTAGISITARLLKADPGLRIAVVEPCDFHDYQPGLTLVGSGAYSVDAIRRRTQSLIPNSAKWVQGKVAKFKPGANQVVMEDGVALSYGFLIVCPGLRLAWEDMPGLSEALGQHGVTSNYRPELAPYTWELIQGLSEGTALFTQPNMPIKCAGAPQKALYLACDHWQRSGTLGKINAEFHVSGAALFGVPHFIPALTKYIRKYQVDLRLKSQLVAIDGPRRKATFEAYGDDGAVKRTERSFDMLHVVPPQKLHRFISDSPLADDAGWLRVDPATLQHPVYCNIFGLGDTCGTSNAKTAAAVRNQVRVVSSNLLAARAGEQMVAAYDGYGACPLTVERGKVILAEFGYGGKLLPTFPFDPTTARRSMWWLKAHFMPWFYWNRVLKGKG